MSLFLAVLAYFRTYYFKPFCRPLGSVPRPLVGPGPLIENPWSLTCSHKYAF